VKLATARNTKLNSSALSDPRRLTKSQKIKYQRYQEPKRLNINSYQFA